MKGSILKNLYVQTFPTPRQLFSKNYFAYTSNTFVKNDLSLRPKIYGGPCRIPRQQSQVTNHSWEMFSWIWKSIPFNFPAKKLGNYIKEKRYQLNLNEGKRIRITMIFSCHFYCDSILLDGATWKYVPISH